MRFTPGPECPVGLANMIATRSTPEISSVTCAVKLTVAGLVVVFTAIGLNVKPVNVGGVVSWLFDVTWS